MDMALNPGMAAPPSRANRGLFTWVAIALVGVLMASSVYWYGQTPPGDDGGQLAWAPGMGTPESTPFAGYACDVEPLTTDEVMDIVRNPQNTYIKRGFDLDRVDDMPTYQEARIDWSQRAATPSMHATGDPALVGPLTELGNSFWGCLITGTSAQVWAMMDPSLLQWTILQNFDVVRTEDDISQFVEEWSSQPYSILPGGMYPQFLNPDAREFAYIVDEELGGIKVSTARGPHEMEVRAGVLRLIPAPESQSSGFYEIYITENPDGSWFITWVEASPELETHETSGG